MRVISGYAKGITLASVPGKSTRPITDRVKEALFNILSDKVFDTTWLDLFGGTGAVGIEALSRDAESVVFIEINYQAYKTILQNLKATRWRIMPQSARWMPSRISTERPTKHLM